jgi:hypothetical protein
LGLTSPAFAVSCTNGNLVGTYNTQTVSTNMTNVLNTLANAQQAGTTAAANGGLVGSSSSLNGNIAALGRYYFDGNGGIIGSNGTVGTYNVTLDCMASIKLNSGQSYSAVLVNQGQQALFLQTDAAGNGTNGLMTRATSMCLEPYPTSLGFSYSGALATAGSTVLLPFATVGSLSLDGVGAFTATTSTFSNGSIQMATGRGTYTMTTNCGIQLTFTPNINSTFGTTGAFAAPIAFNGLLSGPGASAAPAGFLTVQTSQGAILTGTIIPQ